MREGPAPACMQGVLAVMLCAGITAQLIAAAITALVINYSASLPGLIFLRTQGELQCGDIVLICPEGELQQVLLQLGKIHRAWQCPGGTSGIIKRLVALPGDRITLDAQHTICVNGRPLPHSRPDPRLPLPQLSARTLAAGEYLVLGEHRSLDSRYLGPVQAPEIVSALRRLW